MTDILMLVPDDVSAFFVALMKDGIDMIVQLSK